MADGSYDVAQPAKNPNRWFRQLWSIKDTIIIIATPILLIPVLLLYPGKFMSEPAGCAYTILIMITYWMTEVLPMAVTAMLPIVLFPWLGVMGSRQICVNYLKDANMLFFGGLLVAIAVEKWNLHKRVALRVMLLVGSNPRGIMFGFMMVTAFLSMWLNNTATTAMMMPIAHAVLEELDAGRKKDFADAARDKAGHEGIPMEEWKGSATNPDDVQFKNGSQSAIATKSSEIENLKETDPLSGGGSDNRDQSDKDFMCFRKALKIGVPFASNIGGCGTLIGCGPNIVLKGMIETFYLMNEGPGINFTTWFVVGFPTMAIDIVLAWLILMLIFLGPKQTFYCYSKKEGGARAVILAEYKKLGKITFAEVVVMVNFIVLAILWFMRQPDFVPGWGDLFPKPKKSFVTDACVAITISVLLFIFPSRLPNYLCFRRCNNQGPPAPAPPILDWPTVNKQMPWSVILLLGGGFALADGCKVSGLSSDIGTQLGAFKDLAPWMIVAICMLLAMFVTSFTSNMATTTIFIPIMAELSRETQVNPIYLMLPVTLCASYAFILPVSTPPNAIAYSYGDIVITDMIKSGICMCILCFSVLLVAINTWGYAFFNLGHYPSWAPRPDFNGTMLANEMTSLFSSTPTTF